MCILFKTSSTFIADPKFSIPVCISTTVATSSWTCIVFLVIVIIIIVAIITVIKIFTVVRISNRTLTIIPTTTSIAKVVFAYFTNTLLHNIVTLKYFSYLFIKDI